jgi:hypothetical protein
VTIFGPGWDGLELGHVEAFLASAPPEPLLWEAKGDADSAQKRKQVCGFANSHDGGFLILGAHRDGDSWKLDGTAFAGDDPPNAITDVIAGGGVTPFPEGLDVRSWQVATDRHVAVVWIPPIATPPCNTNGTVYERVSGKTIPVQDATRLATLFERGDTARRRAEERGRSAATAMMARQEGREPAHIQFALALTAPAYVPDVSSRLFTTQFEGSVRSSMTAVLAEPRHPFGVSAPTREISQDALSLDLEPTHRLGDAWIVRASWDGTITVYWSMAVEQTSIPGMVSRPLKAAWECADELLGALKPQGARYLQLTVAGGPFPPNRSYQPYGDQPGPLPMVSRGPIAPGVNSETLASIERELRRTAGEPAFET